MPVESVEIMALLNQKRREKQSKPRRFGLGGTHTRSLVPWELKTAWQVENRGYPKLFHTIQPEVREKINPGHTHAIRLTRSIERLDYSEEFAIRNVRQPVVTVIDRASWVDWDQQGRLVFARDGGIFAASIKVNGYLTEERLIDLNLSKPEPVPTPEWATKW